MVLALLLAAAAVPSGGEECPPHSRAFPIPPNTECSVVRFAGAVAPGALDGKNELWKEGLQMYAEHINAQGGLRMGQGAVGYVNLSILELSRDDTDKFIPAYERLCGDPDVHFLLAPLASRTALQTIKEVPCQGGRGTTERAKIYLAGDADEEPDEHERAAELLATVVAVKAAGAGDAGEERAVVEPRVHQLR